MIIKLMPIKSDRLCNATIPKLTKVMLKQSMAINCGSCIMLNLILKFTRKLRIPKLKKILSIKVKVMEDFIGYTPFLRDGNHNVNYYDNYALIMS